MLLRRAQFLIRDSVLFYNCRPALPWKLHYLLLGFPLFLCKRHKLGERQSLTFPWLSHAVELGKFSSRCLFSLFTSNAFLHGGPPSTGWVDCALMTQLTLRAASPSGRRAVIDLCGGPLGLQRASAVGDSSDHQHVNASTATAYSISELGLFWAHWSLWALRTEIQIFLLWTPNSPWQKVSNLFSRHKSMT